MTAKTLLDKERAKELLDIGDQLLDLNYIASGLAETPHQSGR